MEKYPLLVRHRQLILGKGFVAGVDIRGRVLAIREDEGFWLDGVNPGDVAAGGKTILEATASFDRELSEVLVDLSSEAASFEEFKGLVVGLFEQADLEAGADWSEAVQAVREGKLPGALPELTRLSADEPRSVAVENLTELLSPDKNVHDSELALAA